jgi:hypothetical protein
MQMLASFFIQDGIVHIVGSVNDGGIIREYFQTVSPGEDFMGVPYDAFQRKLKGGIEIDLAKRTAHFYGESPDAPNAQAQGQGR